MIVGKTGTKPGAHSLLNNLYSNTVGYRGERRWPGTTVCAREEERVPRDVILTGRGQLSQYDDSKRNEKKRTKTQKMPNPLALSLA